MKSEKKENKIEKKQLEQKESKLSKLFLILNWNIYNFLRAKKRKYFEIQN